MKHAEAVGLDSLLHTSIHYRKYFVLFFSPCSTKELELHFGEKKKKKENLSHLKINEIQQTHTVE